MHDDGGGGRPCIFCDSAIPSGDPGEHVFPKWLSKFLGKGELFTHLPGFYKESTDAPTEPGGENIGRRTQDRGLGPSAVHATTVG